MQKTEQDYHSYRVCEGHGLRHDPFGSLIAPRPIGWISTLDRSGRPNLAPYSFFNAFNYSPPIVGFASVGWKDTAQNISETGEFVWNMATYELAESVNRTSINAPAEIDEFDLAKLGSEPSILVSPPRVRGSPAAMECCLTQVLQLESRDNSKVETWMIFGEVIAVHVMRAMIVDEIVHTALARPIVRGGGNDYFVISEAERFSLRRPKWRAP